MFELQPTSHVRLRQAARKQILSSKGNAFKPATTNYRFLTLIAELDRRKGWGSDGAT